MATVQTLQSAYYDARIFAHISQFSSAASATTFPPTPHPHFGRVRPHALIIPSDRDTDYPAVSRLDSCTLTVAAPTFTVTGRPRVDPHSVPLASVSMHDLAYAGLARAVVTPATTLARLGGTVALVVPYVLGGELGVGRGAQLEVLAAVVSRAGYELSKSAVRFAAVDLTNGGSLIDGVDVNGVEVDEVQVRQITRAVIPPDMQLSPRSYRITTQTGALTIIFMPLSNATNLARPPAPAPSSSGPSLPPAPATPRRASSIRTRPRPYQPITPATSVISIILPVSSSCYTASAVAAAARELARAPPPPPVLTAWSRRVLLEWLEQQLADLGAPRGAAAAVAGDSGGGATFSGLPQEVFMARAHAAGLSEAARASLWRRIRVAVHGTGTNIAN